MTALVVLIALAVVSVPILLIIFINKTVELSRKVEWLEKELNLLWRSQKPKNEKLKSLLKKSVVSEDKEPVNEEEPAKNGIPFDAHRSVPLIPEEMKISPEPPQMPIELPQRETVDTVTSVSDVSSATPMQAAEKIPPTPVSEDIPESPANWEALVGGRLMNRVGAVALIIGIGFFLKYAFDKNWITETMRVVIGAVVGFGFLFAGRYFYKKGYKVFSQGLVGTGIAVLYLCVYASFNFYNLIPQYAAFILMSVVTIFTLSIALRYDSLAVSLLGWAGGFLTPILLSTGHPNAIGLFAYIAILDAGLLAIVCVKERWIALEPMTLAATYLTYFLYQGRYYQLEHLWLSVSFLTVFWLLFFARDIINILRQGAQNPEISHVTAIANSLAYYIGMYSLINPQYPDNMPHVTLLIGLAYLIAFAVLRRSGFSMRAAFLRYVFTILVTLVVAAWLEYEGFELAICWALEAAAILWFAVYWNQKAIWRAVNVLFALTLIAMMFADGAFNMLSLYEKGLAVAIWNERCLSFAVMTAVLLLSGLRIRSADDAVADILSAIYHCAWCVVFFILCTVECIDYTRHIKSVSGWMPDEFNFRLALSLALVWMLYSLITISSGFLVKAKHAVYAGLLAGLIALLTGVFGGLEYCPISKFAVALNFRAMAFVVIAGASAIVAVLLRKKQDDYRWCLTVSRIYQAVVQVLVFVLLTVEVRDFYQQQIYAGNAGTKEIIFNQMMVLPIIWTAYSLLLILYGMRAKNTQSGIIALCAACLAVITSASQGSQYNPIQNFNLIFNIRMLDFIIILAGISMIMAWLRMRKGKYLIVYKIARVVLVIFMLLLINVETRDYFNKEIALAPAENAAGYSSGEILALQNLKQLLISGEWLIYSVIAMAIGIWRKMRWLRVTAIAVFGLAVLKIFVYDLSFLETFYRIFTFMGLGLILMGVSYLYHKYKAVILEDTHTKNEK